MNSFALITKYITQAIDKVFAEESKTEILVNGTKFIDVKFDEAGYVKLATILMDGLSDYHRANTGISSDSNYSNHPTGDGYDIGSAELKWDLYRLRYDRGKQFRIEYMDDEETAGLLMGNLLSEFLRTKVVPEVDTLRLSTIAGAANITLGNLVEESAAISANTIIGKFNTAYEWLSQHEVPSEEQVIFVNPTVMTLIRNTTELSKRLTDGSWKRNDVDMRVSIYEGRPIIEVQDSRFFSKATAGRGGVFASSDSKSINFIVCSKKAVVPVVKHEKSRIFGPEVVQDFDGWKLNFRIYHDVIVPKNKVIGVYANLGNALSGYVNGLSVSTKRGTADNKFIVDQMFTQPGGLKGTLYFKKAAAFSVGGDATGATEVVIGVTELALATTGTVTSDGYFGLLGPGGTIVAVTGKVPVDAIGGA